MHGTREGLALSQDCESVAQVGNVVLGLHFVSVEWFVTLYPSKKETVIHLVKDAENKTRFTYLENLAWVELGHAEAGRARIDNI